MTKLNHHEHPELWFRPSPVLPFRALLLFLEKESITATIRLGKRDGTHPKGYVPGAVATLRLFDDEGQERLCKRVRITDVTSKPFRYFSDPELKDSPHYLMESVREHLAFLEKRPIVSEEITSLVEFAYL